MDQLQPLVGPAVAIVIFLIVNLVGFGKILARLRAAEIAGKTLQDRMHPPGQELPAFLTRKECGEFKVKCDADRQRERDCLVRKVEEIRALVLAADAKREQAKDKLATTLAAADAKREHSRDQLTAALQNINVTLAALSEHITAHDKAITWLDDRLKAHEAKS